MEPPAIPARLRLGVYITGILASGATTVLNGFGVLTGDQHAAIMSGLATIMGGLAVGYVKHGNENGNS